MGLHEVSIVVCVPIDHRDEQEMLNMPVSPRSIAVYVALLFGETMQIEILQHSQNFALVQQTKNTQAFLFWYLPSLQL